LTESFTRSHLAEGVNLYVQPTKKFKTTAIYVYFHLPLAAETVTSNVLLPMVLARGSADHPTTAALSRHLDELYGTSFGVDVIKRGEVHSIVFRMEVPGEAHLPGATGLLQRGLETLAGLITRPALEGEGFKPDYVQQEAQNLKQSIEALVNNKTRWAMTKCNEAMCHDEAFALYRLGRVEDLPQITPESLYKHHQRVLTSAPVDIFVMGEIDVEQAQALVRKTLTLPEAGPEGRQMPKTEVKRKPEHEPKEVVEQMDVNQGVLVVGMRTGLTIRDDEYFPMLVANGVLGGYQHSKLFQEVREKNSLAYVAYSAVETVKGIGYMYAGIEFENRDQCQQIMLEQLKALQAGEIDDEEFETTIHALVHDTLSSADSPAAMADLAVDRVFSGRDLSIEDRVKAYEKVTKEQVAAAAKQFQVDTIFFLNKAEGGE
jgi:predicted Zn-dependent peptidase